MSLSRWLSGSERPQERHTSVDAASVGNEQFTDAALEVPLLGQRQKATTVGAALYVFVLVLYAVIVILSPWLSTPISPYYPAILCTLNVLLLALTGLLQKHISSQVNKERRQGFLRFSDQIKPFTSIPFFILSYGTSGILLILVWSSQLRAIGVPVSLLLRLAILIEILWSATTISLYLWRIHSHNLSHMQPDVIYALHSAIQPTTFLDDLRHLDGGKLAEQQALLLQYQQDNLRYLHEEIFRLQESLSKYERSGDGTSQVDVVHILAAREQELRAMTAERDQFQSELRLARGLIAERDSNMMQIQTTNDRYVEENERLRSMLAEWSARAAKLELALETERISNVEMNKRLALLRRENV